MPEDRSFNPELDQREVRRGRRPGDRYVRVTHNPDFQLTGPDELTVTERADEPDTVAGKIYNRLKRTLIGSPISTAQASDERLSKKKALAVLSSDALSSVAYAPQEILAALLIAGPLALGYSVPIAIAVVLLLLIVGTSYSQTIRAYPSGGGSYSVASENLGKYAGLTAGAALTVGYILTVAVSIASGVDYIISTIPGLEGARVEMCVGFVALVTLANLRGVRESGTIFAVPTYLFVVLMYALIGYGLYRVFSGPPLPPAPAHGGAVGGAAEAAAGGATLYVLLRAFASGCAAMTGTEAISNGVPGFRPVEWKNARTTLWAMVVLLGSLFFGMTYLLHLAGVVPDETGGQTVVSQLAQLVFGEGPLYYLTQVSAVLILVLAANTAYAGFPRLFSVMARDRFVPRQFEFRGDRLAFSNGIIALGIVSSLLLVAFGGDTSALIALYALGVFLAFTMSQGGMVMHSWRRRGPRWRASFAVNLVGASTTGLVSLIVGTVRFREGAWIVLLLLPLFVLLFLAINKHYTGAGRELNPETPLRMEGIKHTIIVPIASVNRVALQTLAYARSISPDNVTAVHVTEDLENKEAFRELWARYEQKYGYLGKLVIIESPYRSLVGPILAYIDAIDEVRPNDTITVVLPEFVPKHWWERLLHNQTALRLKWALLFRPGTVVVNVPYHLGKQLPST